MAAPHTFAATSNSYSTGFLVEIFTLAATFQIKVWCHIRGVLSTLNFPFEAIQQNTKQNSKRIVELDT